MDRDDGVAGISTDRTSRSREDLPSSVVPGCILLLVGLLFVLLLAAGWML